MKRIKIIRKYKQRTSAATKSKYSYEITQKYLITNETRVTITKQTQMMYVHT